jgi:hypothetical protein
MSMSELENVKGRGWDDVDVRVLVLLFYLPTHYALLTPITALSDGVMAGGGLDARSSAARLLRNWTLSISMTTRRRYGSVTQPRSDVDNKFRLRMASGGGFRRFVVDKVLARDESSC